MPGTEPQLHPSMNEASAYAAPNCSTIGEVRGEIWQPEGYQIWGGVATMSRGAGLLWEATPIDHVLHVLGGELRVGGERLSSGMTLIVERGARAKAVASGSATVAHFGGRPPLDRPGGGTHLIGPGPVAVMRSVLQPGFPPLITGVVADGTCRSCTAALLDVCAEGKQVLPSHSHSEDELIYLVSGDLRIGRHLVRPGSTIAIPRGRRYGLRTMNGFRFLNYRAGVSTITIGVRGAPTEETIGSLGMTRTTFSTRSDATMKK